MDDGTAEFPAVEGVLWGGLTRYRYFRLYGHQDPRYKALALGLRAGEVSSMNQLCHRTCLG